MVIPENTIPLHHCTGVVVYWSCGRPLYNYTITLVLVTDATKKPSEIAVPPSATVADVLRSIGKPNALFVYGGYVRDHGARLQDFVRNTRAGRRFVAGILHDPSAVCVADRRSAHFKTWARTLE